MHLVVASVPALGAEAVTLWAHARRITGTKVRVMASTLRAFLTTTAAIAVAAISGAGCGEGSGQNSNAESTATQESTGVPLVRSSESETWNGETRWTIQVDLEIGGRDAPAEYLFGRVRGVDAGPDGRIYVLDDQVGKVSVFDSDGRFAFSFGERGQGPGEFSVQTAGILVEESGIVTVRDDLRRSDHLFDADGRFLRSRPHAERFRGEWAVLPQGGYVTRSRSATSDSIVRLDGDARIIDTVVEFEYDISRTWGVQAGTLFEGKQEIPLLPPQPVWGMTADGRVISGMSNRYHIDVRQPDGSLTMIIEREHEARLIGADDHRRLVDHLKELMGLAGLTEAEIAGGFQRRAFTLPDALPAFAGLVGGPDGTIWVQGVLSIDSMPAHYPFFDVLYPGSPAWEVFSRDGQYLGVINMPRNFTLKKIRGDRIYGFETDELGLQRVVRLKINR